MKGETANKAEYAVHILLIPENRIPISLSDASKEVLGYAYWGNSHRLLYISIALETYVTAINSRIHKLPYIT